MKRHLTVALSIFLLTILTFPAIASVSEAENLDSDIKQRLYKAAEYIVGRYDPRIGLVSESEDMGSNVPDNTPCYRTFWIYSDNLWASKALMPYNCFIARNISKTISPYIRVFGKPNLFEIVLGERITSIRYDRKVFCVGKFIFDGENYTIWVDRHHEGDGGIFYDVEEYADLCLYLALNHYLYGNKENATRLVRVAESMWNGYGFLDKAAKESGLYQNYKLGLYLFTVKAIGYNSTIYDEVENVVWSYQKENGGIATLSYLNGTVYGTANVETTSILLLAYDENLLDRFRRPSFDQPLSTIVLPTVILMIVIILTILSTVVLRKRKINLVL